MMDSPVKAAFDRLQNANKNLTELERQETRLQQQVGAARNEVVFAQKAYNEAMSKARTIDAMAKA